MKKISILLILAILAISILPGTHLQSVFHSAAAETKEYKRLNDPNMLRYLEDSIYTTLIDDLDSDKYFIENVEAVYISKEYIRDLNYNTKSNVFFGYTLEELDAQFQGQRYVFTLGDNGETTVVPYEKADNPDYAFDQIIKNVAIGSGVILVCVTISVVTAGAAPAVSIIFAASAKTGAIIATQSALFGGVSAGIAKGIETGSIEESMEAATLAASEGFKWGAISGALTGGSTEYSYLKGLKKITNMPMDDLAKIQRESRYPLDVVKQFHSYEEYSVYRDSGLTSEMVDGKLALTQNIDLDHLDEMGRTNMERMEKGLAPIDPNTGNSYELHHIGQKSDSTLAILKSEQHRENDLILHDKTIESAVRPDGDSKAWDKQRRKFWKAMATLLGGK